MSDPFGEMVPITPRERELVLHLANGMNLRDAAREMNVTIGTVRSQAATLRRKLQIKRTSQIPGAYYAVTGENPFEAGAWMQ